MEKYVSGRMEVGDLPGGVITDGYSYALFCCYTALPAPHMDTPGSIL
ncbi:MAG: hypothetical protein J6X01_07745 [Bacteroidales bacterium]|nr:hypothetical protein [Bacteroidales bacterium]